MRVGHTGLHSNLKIIHKHPTGTCQFCGVREDMDHVLLSCINYSRQRERVKRAVNVAKKAFHLQTLLGEPRLQNITNAIVTFVKETKLADRI